MGDLADIFGRKLDLKGKTTGEIVIGNRKLTTKIVTQSLRKGESSDDVAVVKDATNYGSGSGSTTSTSTPEFTCHMGEHCFLGDAHRTGTKKIEYGGHQWHHKCFACCNCKSHIGTKPFIPHELDIYCGDCYKEKFGTKCFKCRKVISDWVVKYQGEPWHSECFTCTKCKKELAGQLYSTHDEKPYCQECDAELFSERCFACRKPISGVGTTRFVSFEGKDWHRECFRCIGCQTSLVCKGFIANKDDVFCQLCAKKKLKK